MEDYISALISTSPLFIVCFASMVFVMFALGEYDFSRKKITRIGIPVWLVVLLVAASFVPVLNILAYLVTTFVWTIYVADGFRNDSPLLNKLINFFNKRI